MDETLAILMDATSTNVQELVAQLESGTLTTEAWFEQMADQLTASHAAALRAGLDAPGPVVPPAQVASAASAWLTSQVAVQLDFLRRFAVEITEAQAWQRGWASRAQMYAEAIGASYEAGVTRVLPLPALPRDGSTICLTKCGCRWEIDTLEGEGNYDCRWIRGKNDSCATCMARARRWAPLMIRNGEIV